MLSAIGFSQEDFLAKQYFNDGEFEKAKVLYQKLVKKSPGRTDYAEYYITTLQQLEDYQTAESFLLKKLEQPRVFPTFYIETGYNYALMKREEEADLFYDRAIASIQTNPNYGYAIGHRFQKYSLLNQAVEAYSLAMQLNPEANFDLQLARIYGEQGEVQKMFRAYLSLVYDGKTSRSSVQRYLEDFITENPENTNNILLRKILLQNAQQQPDIFWNEMLSWLFIQQQQYKSAFAQEKAIFKRTDEASLERLKNLGQICLENQAWDTAENIFSFITDKSNDKDTQLNAALELIEIELKTNPNPNLKDLDKQYQNLLATYGQELNTLNLQIAYANFLTFKMSNAAPAIALLRESMDLPMGRFGTAYLKMALGDILVFDQKFNQALIYFTQVQQSLKNDVLAQDARFKVAQTSFYKGDFDWALTQLKVLRSSTSQLIANDAMQLSLLISDNSQEDSTQTALKKYARADLLAYQNKTQEAIDALTAILTEHKGESIEDEALLKQAQLLESQNKYDDARFNYIKIIEFYADGILADDAHFRLAQLLENKLGQPEMAKEYYEKIIFNFKDSYYFPQARKNYRRLRGDTIN